MHIDRFHHVAYWCRDAKEAVNWYKKMLDMDFLLAFKAKDPNEAELMKKADSVRWDMLEEWSRTKRAPRQAAFLHDKEFKGSLS